MVVSGQDEIMRWVLSWGREAKALGPGKFTGKVQKEIAAMAGSYRHRK